MGDLIGDLMFTVVNPNFKYIAFDEICDRYFDHIESFYDHSFMTVTCTGYKWSNNDHEPSW